MRSDLYVFDVFRLDDELVPLRDKVFDTLVLLVRGAGRLQASRDLIDELWPEVSVEPNNLQHNISILRKALSGSAVQIETVRGRGYRLLADVEHVTDDIAEARDKKASDPSLHQQIQFWRSPDGTSLAWAVTGNGPPIVKAGN